MHRPTPWNIPSSALWIAFILFSLAVAATVSGEQPARSTPALAAGRYQLIEGAIPEVFDTQTGKGYVWMPKDEKAGADPYIIIRDPVNATGIRAEIRWKTQTVTK